MIMITLLLKKLKYTISEYQPNLKKILLNNNKLCDCYPQRKQFYCQFDCWWLWRKKDIFLADHDFYSRRWPPHPHITLFTIAIQQNMRIIITITFLIDWLYMKMISHIALQTYIPKNALWWAFILKDNPKEKVVVGVGLCITDSQ